MPEGYAILKTHAWLDRLVRNEYKDAADLALVVHWYAEDVDRLYAGDNVWAMDLHDFDLRLAAAALLGRDMANGLSSGELTVLAERIGSADRDLLAHYFAVGAPGWPVKDRDRRLIVNAVFDQLTT